MSRSWDVFCKVIDNFGDAAVCWRLARQLAAEHGGRVRLWIDAPGALHMLCAAVAGDRAWQSVAGVEVCRWVVDADFGAPAEIAIDAFGCGLPDAYAASMAERDPRSLWIILEYLSAEPWVSGHHGLPSPHPRLPLERYFFFPGVVPGTGGVLREASLERRRGAFECDPMARDRFWRGLGFSAPAAAACVVSLFGYQNQAVGELLQIWAGGEHPVVLAVAWSPLRDQSGGCFGTASCGDGTSRKRGKLEARFLPFVEQTAYDELLWASDWNFVRGEDSFVRAQWAARPMVWHIYPQAEGAHRVKLEAFLDLYCAGLDNAVAVRLRGLWQGWNQSGRPLAGQLGTAWKGLEPHADALRKHARNWPGRLALPGGLAGNLAQYCENILK